MEERAISSFSGHTAVMGNLKGKKDVQLCRLLKWRLDQSGCSSGWMQWREQSWSSRRIHTSGAECGPYLLWNQESRKFVMDRMA